MSPVPEMLKNSSPTGAMSEADREAEVANLIAQATNIQKRLDAMGVRGKQNKPKLAPDGGPSSDFHVRLRTQLNKTVAVRLKEFSNKLAVIRSKDFDADIHELVEQTGPRIRSRPKPAGEEKLEMSPAPIAVGMQTREELLTMTMKGLLKLPEVSSIASDEVPENKDELVEAILDVRAKLKS